MKLIEIQLGKNGLSQSFLSTLKTHFNKNNQVRISVLKSAGHDKEIVKKYSEQILNELGVNYTARMIGFKIILKKWRRPQR